MNKNGSISVQSPSQAPKPRSPGVFERVIDLPNLIVESNVRADAGLSSNPYVLLIIYVKENP